MKKSLIFFSFLFALVFILLPLPDKLGYLRPQMLILVLIGWIIQHPERINVSTVWFIGLFCDLCLQNALGENALIMVATLWGGNFLKLQMQCVSFWQKTCRN